MPFLEKQVTGTDFAAAVCQLDRVCCLPASVHACLPALFLGWEGRSLARGASLKQKQCGTAVQILIQPTCACEFKLLLTLVDVSPPTAWVVAGHIIIHRHRHVGCHCMHEHARALVA